MQRQRGELVPIGDALSGLGGPMKAVRDDSPQARRGFTVADQVDRLVWASEAAPDRGFIARLIALCSLPRTNPGNRKEYIRRNGPYTLGMSAGINTKLPFGNLPRLLLAWVCTEATVNALIADRTELWWTLNRPDQAGLWGSKILLSELFFNEIINHPVPLDMNTLKALKRCSLGIDLYLWLSLPHLLASCSVTALLGRWCMNRNWPATNPTHRSITYQERTTMAYRARPSG